MKLPLRIGVGIVLLNNKNKIFVAKRIDNPKNFWQMPQGGVDNKEKYLKWLVKDCLLVYCPVIAALSFISMFPFQGINRWENLIYLMGISLVALIIAAISSSFFRNKLVIRIKGI